jgi:phosphoserine phosphatase
VTKFILTRHGHVEGIDPERFRGRLELALTSTGRRQAIVTAERIAVAWEPVAIYTSPMSRSVATAKAIGAAVGVDVQADARLNDIDYGAWQGLTPEEARSRWPDDVEAWYRAPHLASPAGGETLQTVLARVAAALHEILRRHSADTVVLVGHDSVNRVILLHALDLPLSHYWRLKQDPCGITELDVADGLYTARRINETWHLHGPA